MTGLRAVWYAGASPCHDRSSQVPLPSAPASAPWQAFLDFLALHRIGDLASLLGILISVVGFGVTVWTAARAKRAAVQAAEAAERVAADLKRHDLVQDLTMVMATIDEIRRLNAIAGTQFIPDRIIQLRRVLVGIRSRSVIDPADQKVLQGLVTLLNQMEKGLWSRPVDELKISGLHMSKLMARADKVHSIMQRVRDAVVGGDHV